MRAGVRKMPLPMVEPTSTATALHRPRRRGRRSPHWSVAGVPGALIRGGNIPFAPYDATLHPACLDRRRLHLLADHPWRRRPHHGLGTRLWRTLAALQRPPPAAARPAHVDQIGRAHV